MLNFSQKIGPALSVPAKQNKKKKKKKKKKRTLHINMWQIYVYMFCLNKLKK